MTNNQPHKRGDGQIHTARVGSKPTTACTTIIQNRIDNAVSVRVSDFAKIMEMLKPIAAPSAIN